METYSVQMGEPPIYNRELEDQMNSLKVGPKILVLGEMLEGTVQTLVRNEKQLGDNYLDTSVIMSDWLEHSDACKSFPNIVILVARLENERVFSKCAQMLDRDFDKLGQLFHHSQSKTILVILYAIKIGRSIEENSENVQRLKERFCWNFTQFTKVTTTIKPHHDVCIVFNRNDELSKTISEHLELHIVSCLRLLEDKLKVNFHHRIQSSDPYNKSRFMDMIKQDLTSLISKDGGIISKLESEFKCKIDTLSTDTLKDFLFDAQIHAVQMRIEELSSSFGICTTLIVKILNKINFQQQCKACIQDSTVQKLMPVLRSMRDPTEREVFPKRSENKENQDFIALFITDISLPIEAAVTQIECVEKSLCVQERLHFETISILRRTIAKKEVEHLISDIKIPTDIQFIKGVKGFGIIYNKLHIHIQQLDEEGDRKVRKEISKFLQDYRYPYEIGVNVSDPKPLYSHYVGQKIASLCSINGMNRIFGSVGAFMKDHSGDMYILTSHHVICVAANALDVCLVSDDEKYTRIGSTIYKPAREEGKEALFDIAAVKVINDHAKNCNVQFKKPDGMTGLYDIFHGSLEDINGRSVYKRGASTGLTFGLIASANYFLMEMAPEWHFWIVPEDEPQGLNSFAEKGDSGASVCAVEEDDDGKVHVLGMVRAGDIKIRGTNGRDSGAVLAFSMHEGIKALNLELRPYEY